MIPLPPALLALALSLTLAPQPTIPAPTGYVNDFAGVLRPDDVARMTRLIDAVRAGSRGEIVVVTLRDLDGRDVGDVALRIGREWGVGERAEVGDRARNAGVVVLLIPRETSADGRGYISIQVGQGAEGFITDGTAGEIRREATPYLARAEYGQGLTLITARLAQRYSAEFGFALDSAGVPPRRRSREPTVPPIVVLIVIFVVLNLLLSSRRGRRGLVVVPFPVGRRGGWGGGFGGGFGGGGFGGFGGGGGFSGGGSSGSF